MIPVEQLMLNMYRAVLEKGESSAGRKYIEAKLYKVVKAWIMR